LVKRIALPATIVPGENPALRLTVSDEYVRTTTCDKRHSESSLRIRATVLPEKACWTPRWNEIALLLYGDFDPDIVSCPWEGRDILFEQKPAYGPGVAV
jgi:hypothetical protein